MDLLKDVILERYVAAAARYDAYAARDKAAVELESDFYRDLQAAGAHSALGAKCEAGHEPFRRSDH